VSAASSGRPAETPAATDPTSAGGTFRKQEPARFDGDAVSHQDFENMYVMMDKRLSVGSFLASPVIAQGMIIVGSAEGILYAPR
jgi:hypothetical protein